MDTVGTAALITVSDQTGESFVSGLGRLGCSQQSALCPHTRARALAGVSVNLAVTYLLPAPEGSDVTVEAHVVRAGKSLATIQV